MKQRKICRPSRQLCSRPRKPWMMQSPRPATPRLARQRHSRSKGREVEMSSDAQPSRLFDYTKFHIGVYITLVGILLGALIKLERPNRIPRSEEHTSEL